MTAIPKLAIVAMVLLLAWYAGREGVSLGIAVAVVGLTAVRWRPVPGMLVAGAMAAAAVYAPGVALAAACLVVVLVLLSKFVDVLLGWGGVPPSDGLTSSDAASLG